MNQDWSFLLGMTLEEAKAAAAEQGYCIRITRKNGNYGVITADYRTDRINVHVETRDGNVFVTHVTGAG